MAHSLGLTLSWSRLGIGGYVASTQLASPVLAESSGDMCPQEQRLCVVSVVLTLDIAGARIRGFSLKACLTLHFGRVDSSTALCVE